MSKITKENNMQQIYFYCGSWSELMKRGDVEEMIVIGQHTETPAEMSEKGRQLLRTAMKGNGPVRVFCNNDNVLNGLRVAIRKTSSAEVAAKVVITYVNASGEAIIIPINYRGKLTHWPDGFFDQIETDLSELTGWW